MPTQTVTTRGLTAGQKLAGGLTVVLKSGKLYYRSSVYAKHLKNGQSTKLWLVSEKTITEAKAWHDERKVEVRGLTGKVSDDWTLRDALVSRLKYIREEAEINGDNVTYAKHLERNFSKWVEPFGIADMKLSKLEESHALNFIRYLRRQDLTYDTRLAILNSVRTPLKHAREQGKMKRGFDPFRDIDPKEYGMREDKEVRVLDNDEVEALILVLISDEFRKLTETDYSNAILVHMCEGERVMETLGHHFSDLEVVKSDEGEHHFLHVLGQLTAEGDFDKSVRTKNRRTRNKALHPISRAAILRQRQIEWAKGKGKDDDLMFTMADGTPLPRWNFARATKRAAEMAGIGHLTPRDLRRSLCTAMEHAGVGDVEAAADTGHDPATRRKYYVKARGSNAQKIANTAAVVGSGYGMVKEAL